MDRGIDLVIVGAGLAGLAAALRAVRHGRSVRVLEASDAPGGRMRTDVVDGFRIDRGFQVLNSAYPALQALAVLDTLDLQRFGRGALLHHDGRLHRLEDPREHLAALPGDLHLPIGSPREQLTLAAFLAECGYAGADRIRRRRDVEFRQQLRRWHLTGRPTERFIRPFLSGVLLESELTTSSRFVDFVWRTFVRGQVVVPADGIQALPRALASALPDDAISYHTEVVAVRPHEVDTTAGTIRADAVIVAADPRRAATLLDRAAPTMHGVTTVWHATPDRPTDQNLLALDSTAGPVVNSVVISNVAPTYSRDGRALIASSYLGTTPIPERALRDELSRIWGTDVTTWETVAVSTVPDALPALPGGSPLRRRVALTDGLYVAGDWRDTPSTQGALVSGRRAAEAYLHRR